ncbi:ABC-type glycerol-3-phosphate transport system, substrate-binding protein [Paenibacillus sp. UNCCL117]|uniref:extracellular solute-binding protein n=1 Tax=unclassified Paenibacillus TaxID=185978 RepID=UPI00088AA04D|nr:MULTISPECIES: extracellular solute-binding protein [unclassified Paenibacillus]SDE26004.1 ABC-type glycerol-3-phosphate transport system, substrate-binding protein [Paenibacillus sp. cl123]SFW62533.1 ABC-type glycerol-3-phosphate transport system, substrate-binding protein [Paenibacillus sp. UNCCL117]
MIGYVTRYRGVLIGIAVILALVWWFSGDSAADDHPGERVDLEGLQTYAENSYQNYLRLHRDKARPGTSIQVEGEAYSRAEGEAETVSGPDPIRGKALKTGETGQVTWTFQVQEAGLYNLGIRYYTVQGKSSSIERKLLVNGQLPFQEAESFIFDRVWTNERQPFKQDNRSNELRPSQIEKFMWQEALFKDANGLTEKPFLFYFPKGENTLTLQSLREPVVIDYIKLYQEEEALGYAELKDAYARVGAKSPANISIKVQGEHAMHKSSPTLYPQPDHTSPSVEPYHVSKIRMNSIGGQNWRMPGQWMEWTVDVPEEGLYKLAIKGKQNLARGIYSSRKLYIDGKVPFKEVESNRFYYDADYQLHTLGGAEEPYLFHLTKGTHTIRLEVNLGDISPLIRTVESSVLELNAVYRQILMITSAQPDPYRDYQLERRIPDLAKGFTAQRNILYTVAEQLRDITGEKSDKTAILYTLSRQLEEMAQNPHTVAQRLDQFKINIGSLGTWLLTIREMPLQLDYLLVASPDVTMPAAHSPISDQMRHELGAFFYSFIEDYNTIGSVAEADQERITVWIGTGRDQAQVMKEMIEDTFTAKNGIHVDLKLVDNGTLLSATLAGQGPDVALEIGTADPVNYAMRNAAFDVSQFADFEQVASRFRESALVPLRFNGGVYALPEQQLFSMLFYRKDIMNELGLEVPGTWDDVHKMIPELQKRYMQFGLPIQDQKSTMTPNDTFSMLLFQTDGNYYEAGGKRSALDQDVAMRAFGSWTDFYTSYKFPLQFDFMNRFRLGEMPIGIAPYNTYNVLTVAAPEIRGLWDFTVVPGTPDASGGVRREVASGGTAVMMLQQAKNKEASWQFMKWWTDKNTQVRFGREMESLMGAAARYPTANIEALQELPWPVKDYQNLEKQWQWVRGIPEVPGGYFTGRHLDNAFRKVVNLGENPREALYDHVLVIHNEIALKRKEFGLPDETEVPADAAADH